MKLPTKFWLCGVFVFIAVSCMSQDYHWYVLKSVNPVEQTDQKPIMVALQAFFPELEIWYNEGSSNTFGCKIEQTIHWNNALPQLNAAGYFLADVTSGEEHLDNLKAPTSIYYQRAYCYYLHPELSPAGFTAKLNQDEWDALPDEAKSYYMHRGRYFIVP